jgi:hypothetical protein
MMKYKRLDSIVALGMSVLAVSIGMLLYFAFLQVCPNCHSANFVTRQWAMPESWNVSERGMPSHPESIPGTSQFWHCNKCQIYWTNPFNVRPLYQQDFGHRDVRRASL